MPFHFRFWERRQRKADRIPRVPSKFNDRAVIIASTTATCHPTSTATVAAGGVADFDVDSKSALENQFRVDASMSLANVPFIQLSFT